MKKIVFFILLGICFLFPVSASAISINPISFPVGTSPESITCLIEENHSVIIFFASGEDTNQNCDCFEATPECGFRIANALSVGDYVLVEMDNDLAVEPSCGTHPTLNECRGYADYVGESSFTLTDTEVEGEGVLFKIPSNFATSVLAFMGGTIEDIAPVIYILIGLALAFGVIIFLLDIFEKNDKKKP